MIGPELPATVRLVAVMDRLRSPGGCPWDARQTHASLARYLLEETYEVLEALDTGDRELLREELGDLLLQVVFHTRITAEDDRAPFGFDDVAADVARKLVRRHPHVFLAGTPEGAAAGAADDATDPGSGAAAEVSLEIGWEQRKRAEKGRRSVFEGIPAEIPALLLATKMLDRLAAADLDVPLPAPIPTPTPSPSPTPGPSPSPTPGPTPGPSPLSGTAAGADGDGSGEAERAVGQALLALVVAARAAGVEPEQALRGELRRLRAAAAAAEERSHLRDGL